MSDLKKLLSDAASGDRRAAANLLPLVYEELRKLAAARMAAESSDHTLQPTALVHEAFLRLIGTADTARWANHNQYSPHGLGRGEYWSSLLAASRRQNEGDDPSAPHSTRIGSRDRPLIRTSGSIWTTS